MSAICWPPISRFMLLNYYTVRKIYFQLYLQHFKVYCYSDKFIFKFIKLFIKILSVLRWFEQLSRSIKKLFLQKHETLKHILQNIKTDQCKIGTRQFMCCRQKMSHYMNSFLLIQSLLHPLVPTQLREMYRACRERGKRSCNIVSEQIYCIRCLRGSPQIIIF